MKSWFRPIWTNLDNSRPTWTCLNLFEHFQTSLNKSRKIVIAIFCPKVPFAQIKDLENNKKKNTIWAHLELFISILMLLNLT